MYAHYFGFREMPFNITPDPKFLFLSPTHEEALQHLRYGINEKKGFIVLTGEVGCGKTTLCRKLLEEIDEKTIETALILNPRLSETQLLQAILRELGVERFKRSRDGLHHQLNEHLLSRVAHGKDIVLIIDESQNMSFEALEHVRLLSNLETNTRKLLQIILIGQPELKHKLQQEQLRQLRQRVLVYYNLRSLSRAEICRYIHHRLTLAGGGGEPEFTFMALRKIYRHTKGIPRKINSLCDKALLSAFVHSRKKVTWWDVRNAVKDLEAL